jgi:serine phosphatase RsbU (regulator of sigma subunit)
MNRVFVPLLRSDRHLSAVMIADERGREHILFHLGDDWHSRQMARDLRHDRAAVTEWSEQEPIPRVTWRDLDYDPRTRPWYRGAVGLSAAPLDASAARVYWTEPYVFFTTRLPGVTAALEFRGSDGVVRVAGFDLHLTDISAFTTSLRPGTRGEVLVLADDGRVIGLPGHPRFEDPAARAGFLLKRPEELGLPAVTEAIRALSSRPPGDDRPVRFAAAAEPWWADSRPFDLGSGRRLSMVVMVPEADLVGSIRYVQIGTLAVMIAGLLAAIARAAHVARRYSRPIEALARDSERISLGDLEAGAPIASRTSEIRRLLDAHEHMRVGLRTLLKLERDLQVARRIQQDTFPTELPALAGFEIGAWNEPAEQTGGDSYDVIGYRRPAGAERPRVSAAGADRAVLLVADAAGHGIGPALSVTQVRGMLRMAVRTGEDLPAIIGHLNAQLCADLSDGRFVTAWFGELDARAGTLRTFSCGLGPILLYRARDASCDVLETDAVPLGVDEDLEVLMREAIPMGPGDVLVVSSDGIVEAADPTGARFGTRRLIDIVREHHRASASALLETLRSELAAFTGPVPPDDDRTVLVVKRSAAPSS